jgi:nucleotide-binding universal stress UspA family protein
MYRHILIATDGSRLAAKGVKAGVKLAKALGARVMGIYVVPRYPPPVYGGDGAVFVPEITPERFAKAMKSAAAKALRTVETEARAAAVRCTTEAPTDDQPWQGILRVARAELRCHRHGLARTRRPRRADPGQRDDARARALENSGARRALSRIGCQAPGMTFAR